MMSSSEDSAYSVVQNFGFAICTAAALVFLAGTANEDEAIDVESEDNEQEIILENYLEDAETTNSNLEVYSMMLKDMDKAPEIGVERMPTFNEMLNPKRRSYSADDIDALCLISDCRLQAVYDRALSEVTFASHVTEDVTIESEGRQSRMSCESWDRLSS